MPFTACRTRAERNLIYPLSRCKDEETPIGKMRRDKIRNGKRQIDEKRKTIDGRQKTKDQKNKKDKTKKEKGKKSKSSSCLSQT
ncbi:hypothetical protein GCM10010917_38580 [Paenibacillus physcomitrellae]|uniref:Uncharacterized protein n=2 Tax=Paenibacillus physcomitrellae TaxID=1619311 RepID=A0ABQ1GT37_9BACL|nr:hypothetical protein GCM10010917_38580 [Paenibacillus physcomitrellae]